MQQYVDCQGVCGGTANLDMCGACAGGNTGEFVFHAKKEEQTK